MKLTIVFTVLGQHDMATLAIQQAIDNCTDPDTRIVVIDNGMDYDCPIASERVDVVRPPRNLGVYPVFDYAMRKFTDSEIVAFFHSDLIVSEKGFDEAILLNFKDHPRLGLMGFVGSTEIDPAGGRGGGTTSNFQGNRYFKGLMNTYDDKDQAWVGSLAEAHGKRNAGYTNAAVVDGCAMIVRRSAWEKIGFRTNFPPHHFYDKLVSTQMLEAGYQVGVLGIACDHLGGQTVSREQRYPDMVREWCEENLSPEAYVGNPPNYSWDQTVYRCAEDMWLVEYRDKKHIVPIKV